MTKSSAFTSEFCSGPERLRDRIRLRRWSSTVNTAITFRCGSRGPDRAAQYRDSAWPMPHALHVEHDPTEGPIRLYFGRNRAPNRLRSLRTPCLDICEALRNPFDTLARNARRCNRVSRMPAFRGVRANIFPLQLLGS